MFHYHITMTLKLDLYSAMLSALKTHLQHLLFVALMGRPFLANVTCGSLPVTTRRMWWWMPLGHALCQVRKDSEGIVDVHTCFTNVMILSSVLTYVMDFLHQFSVICTSSASLNTLNNKLFRFNKVPRA